MKIVFVSSHPADSFSANFGDVIRKKYIVQTLEKQGHHVLAIIAGDIGRTQDAGQANHRRKSALKRFIPLKLWGTVKDLQYLRHDRRLNRCFFNRVKAFGPDLIYDFNFYLHRAGLDWGEKLNVPVVMEVEGPEAQVRYADESSFLRGYGERFEIEKYKRAHRIIVISSPFKDYLISKGVPQEKIDIIPNGVDCEKFDANRTWGADIRTQFSGDSVIVGFVGVFSPWYQLDALVEAVADLAPRFPSLRLLLVGDGVMKQALETQIAKRGLAAKVVITGFVRHEEVPRYIAAMDIAVIPNHQWWCSPLKLFEYGAMAKPVIAPRVPSISAVVGNKETYLIPPNSKEELSKALKQLLDSPALRRRLGGKLFQKIKSDYDYPVIGQKFSNLLTGMERRL